MIVIFASMWQHLLILKHIDHVFKMLFLNIALASTPKRLFDYLPPDGVNPQDLLPGIRVLVPFGRQQRVGVLVDTTQHTQWPISKLKKVIRAIDSQPLLTKSVLTLCLWLSDYYCANLGDTLIAALPTRFRQQRSQHKMSTRWKLCNSDISNKACVAKNASRQHQALTVLNNKGETDETVLKAEGISQQTLSALEKKGLISKNCTQKKPQPFFNNAEFVTSPSKLLTQKPLVLSEEQRAAMNAILPFITPDSQFKTVLLHGVTGSGKTEVYLQLIHEVLKKGRQALVLVPEIGLAPQMINRCQKRFNISVAFSHSGLSDTERVNAWQNIRSGEAGIMIGTRSAIFSPLIRPGIIIVDEEHDSAYKQMEGPRYSARDLAIYRAKLESIPVILGSATPSLESYHNAQIKRYQYITLKQRAGCSRLPSLHLTDIRHQILEGGLCQHSLAIIEQALKSGEQILVFINRRGFAPSLLCNHCGHTILCPNCDCAMTLHKIPPHLSCHHCEHRRSIPPLCPNCHQNKQSAVGAGSEQCEQILNQYFPSYPVLRIDRDSTRKKNALNELLAFIHEEKPCILVGTQMLAKGHHFPAVTRVIILNADTGFFSADFRGTEKTVQLINQVAGRAGRGNKPGKVFVQTRNPEHPYLNRLVHQQEQQLIIEILEHREQLKLPPFGYMALLSSQSAKSELASHFLAMIRQQANQIISQHSELYHSISIVGPMAAPMEKKQGKFRFQIIIRSDQRKSMQLLLRTLNQYAENVRRPNSVRWLIDVDPHELS